MGRSSPCWARTWARNSGDGASPASSCAGSPGARRIRKNVIVTMTSKSGTATINRRAQNQIRLPRNATYPAIGLLLMCASGTQLSPAAVSPLAPGLGIERYLLLPHLPYGRLCPGKPAQPELGIGHQPPHFL